MIKKIKVTSHRSPATCKAKAWLRLFFIAGVWCLVSGDFAFANNLAITNTTLASQDTSADTIKVQFDISWDNSWSDSSNKDAAWVFTKYSTDGGTTWNHATLKTAGTNPTNFSQGSGTAINIVVPTDKKGALIQRSAQGSGTLTTTSVQFVWDYAADGVSDTNADAAATVIKVLGIEMVYIPQGGFYAGDSTAGTNGELRFGTSSNNLPGTIDSEAKISFANSVSTQWYYTTASNSGEAATGSAFEVSAAFPKGYQAFYLMKYEITEGQYVDFLNMLTRTQQNNRVLTDVSGDAPQANKNYVMSNATGVTNRNNIICPLSGNGTTSPITFSTTRPNRPTGYLSWMDLAAYLDWAALRPITELEFEKACRGPLSPVSGEYAWGTTTITAGTTVSGTENGTETVSTASANTIYNNQNITGGDASDKGPVRAGVFATSSTVTRGTTGAGYYGNMELTGNVAERVVTLGNGTGRSFAGTHGDGVLTSLSGFEGNATNLNWPGISSTISQGVTGATGSGFKGGSWSDTATPRLTISGRPLAASTDTTRGSGYGGRGARTENS